MNRRLPNKQYWPVYATCLGIWSTGVAWLTYHYFVHRQSDFGIAPHPMEHWSLVAHGALGFASLWLMGFLWGTHVVKRWRLRRHRKTGSMLFTVMLLLVGTGYLLYYLPSDALRAPTAVFHWALGLAMPLALFGHWLVRSR